MEIRYEGFAPCLIQSTKKSAITFSFGKQNFVNKITNELNDLKCKILKIIFPCVKELADKFCICMTVPSKEEEALKLN